MMKTKNKILVAALSVGVLTLFNSYASSPKNAKAVENFDVNINFGTWYEIARFDFRFEINMKNV